MNTYIAVPAATFEGLLRRGFVKASRGGELAYVRAAATNPKLSIEILTSVPVDGAVARAKDSDAIRVLLVAEAGPRGRVVLHSAKVLRVNSLDGVKNRTWEAVKGAARRAQAVSRVCPRCGAPAYTDSGRCVVRACRDKKGSV